MFFSSASLRGLFHWIKARVNGSKGCRSQFGVNHNRKRRGAAIDALRRNEKEKIEKTDPRLDLMTRGGEDNVGQFGMRKKRKKGSLA